MNATGKSTFGKRLSAKLNLKRIDTDTECTKQVGDIRNFIEAQGLKAFRKLEEEVIASALLPGNLVVLSGGAIETPAVRTVLQSQAVVIWIQAGKARVVRNITMAKKARHEFAHGAPQKVAAALLKKRTPLYESVADIILDESLPYAQYLPAAIAKLEAYVE